MPELRGPTLCPLRSRTGRTGVRRTYVRRLDEHSFGVNRRASGQSRAVRAWIGGRLGTPLPRTYRRIFGTLITLVRDRATAEDRAQETLERAYRSWASWRPDAPVEAAAPKHLRAVLGR